MALRRMDWPTDLAVPTDTVWRSYLPSVNCWCGGGRPADKVSVVVVAVLSWRKLQMRWSAAAPKTGKMGSEYNSICNGSQTSSSFFKKIPMLSKILTRSSVESMSALTHILFLLWAVSDDVTGGARWICRPWLIWRMPPVVTSGVHPRKGLGCWRQH